MSGKTGLKYRIPKTPGTKDGIVAVLGEDSERNGHRSEAASIRRTLSADMSSRKWHQQIGFFFSPLPRTTKSPPSSSSTYSSSTSSVGEEFDRTPAQDDVWKSIQASNSRSIQATNNRETWGSILSQNSEASLLSPPYVHPLARRSSLGGMSQRSLDLCTEILGSETGCDFHFPHEGSNQCLNVAHSNEERPKENRYISDPYADLRIVKYRRVPTRPLPDACVPNLCLQSHREDGRLILDAVPFSPRNNFQVCREDGRLVLTLVGRNGEKRVDEQVSDGDAKDVPPKKVTISGKDVTLDNVTVDKLVFKNTENIIPPKEVTIDEQMCDNYDNYENDVSPRELIVDEQVLDNTMKDVRVEEAVDVAEREELVVDNRISLLGERIKLSTAKSYMMKKFVAMSNVSTMLACKKREEITIPHSISMTSRLGLLIPSARGANSLNVYEYFWKNKVAGFGGFVSFIPHTGLSSSIISVPVTVKNRILNETNKGNLVIKRDDIEEHLLPYLRGCKEPKWSMLKWEPSCIATS